MNNIQSGTDVGGEILTTVIGEFIGALQSANNPYATDGTVPDILRQHVINRTRWLWLCEFPALKNSQTADRKAQNDAAEKFRDNLIETGKPKVEPPPNPDPTAPTLVVLPAFHKRHRDFTKRNQDG
jgi:hypothetical protein